MMLSSSKSAELSITYSSPGALQPFSHNARTHSKRQIRQIAESIKAFGFTNPILIDGNNTIIAGHGRVQAAKLLGMEQVPTVRLENLTEDQIRAYVLADNRLAESAGWSKSILAIEFQHLLKIETDFDISVTGFEIAEIDLILGAAEPKPEADDAFQPLEGPAITQAGDLWLLADHRLLCGDALDEKSYATLMAGRAADVAFVDPPYNVKIDGNVAGHGAVYYREFATAVGEMTEAEFTSFLTTSLSFLAKYSKNGSVHFVCQDWRHMAELLAAGKKAYHELLNVCVWAKDNGGLGSFYRSQHEMVFVFRNGNSRHLNNIQLGVYGRNRTNVWRYPRAATLSRRGAEDNLLALHPTAKPVALVADALQDCSRRGDVVLDTFLGSGTTLMAATRVGRICYGMELDPLYIDTAIRRWQQHTGERVIHTSSGKAFDEIAMEVVRGSIQAGG